jgi:OmpA-OmpF porin, OOP family
MKKTVFLGVMLVSLNVGAAVISVPKDVSKIQAAIDKAENKDTVLVSDGLYFESITMKDEISLIGQSARGTIISGNKREPVIKAGDKTVIKNLTVQNGSTGIICENVMPTIRNCIIKDNKGTGIHCLVTLADILNNVIIGNEWTGIYCESVHSIKTSIQHNVIADNGYCGIMLHGNSEVLVQNNVIINNRKYGIYAEESSRKSRITYNNIYGNRTSNNYFAITDRSNIQENPQYPMIGKVYDYYGSEASNLKGKGKDGSTIGIINDSDLNQIMNDPDIDGVLGAQDLCKDIQEDFDKFQDDDGCPDFDNDQDGIYDNQDLCPDSAEDFDNFRDDDGCPDPDNDKDGVLDGSDLCPNNVEVMNGYKDDDGCPDEVPVQSDKSKAKDKSEPVKAEPAKTEPVKAGAAQSDSTQKK